MTTADRIPTDEMTRKLAELSQMPGDALADLLQRGARHLAQGHNERALTLLNQAVALDPCSADAHYRRGNCLTAMRQFQLALSSFDRVLALQPEHIGAHVERSRILLKVKDHAGAFASALRATALDGDSADAWAVLGRVAGKLRQYPVAIGAFRRALAIDPGYPFLKGRLLQQMVLGCDWTGMKPLIAEIEADLAAGKPSARPFVWQAVATSPASMRRCAYQFGASALAAQPAELRGSSSSNGRIRIGYLSGELRDHSVSYLRVGVFEHHDKDRFDVIAFDNGWDDGGPTRARINKAIDRIIDIRNLSDADAAAVIAREGIDVLIDLNGYNGANRLGVFARHPAALQASLPGYPGTLGIDCLDYIVADATVLPESHFPFYAEQPVHLPYSYQPNDREKSISDRTFERTQVGLPEQGFVFCCFNNSYKIMPEILDVWADLLSTVDGSVLWLLGDNATAIRNLRREAAARGVDPDRLVFADRMPMPEHLARHRCADLFLDTLPCNAHTTASDALWTGLPVLTCLGETFSGRVAASLLKAIGLPDLICTSLADYRRKAFDLATDPHALAVIKRTLAANRLTTPLFDTERYTRDLETAYVTMHERRVAGLPPAPIMIAGD